MKGDLLLFVETHGASDLHRTVDGSSGGESPSDGRHKTSLIVRSGSPNLPDFDRTADGGQTRTRIMVRSGLDRAAIRARSCRDRDSFEANSRPRSSRNRGHHLHYHDASNGRIFRPKSPLKPVYSPFLFLKLLIDS